MSRPPLWSLSTFLALDTPPKEPIIHGLLSRRDLIGFAGRRRHGKTTFTLNLGVSLASGRPLLGYDIERPFRVAAFLLEDDTREIQDKIRIVVNGSATLCENLFMFTREYFYRLKMQIAISNRLFVSCVKDLCEQAKPDVVILDNAAQLLSGDMNSQVQVHKLADLCRDLCYRFNCATVVPAHPRKANEHTPSLTTDPEGFFEEIMGSSHFANSFGSLWGIERDKEDLTHFLGGQQRLTGFQSALAIRKRDDGWFEVADDYYDNVSLATNTPKREAAWKVLPAKFNFNEAYRLCEPHIKSKESFSEWIKHLCRLRLVYRFEDGSYHRAERPQPKTSKQSPVSYISAVPKE